LRETTALKNANHPNIIGLKGVIWDGPNLQLVLEFMDSDIKRWLNYGTRKCEADLLRSYAFQLLCGCAVLHLHGIVHHNLQPSHVLINKHGLLKLCDFGSAILSEFPRSVPEQKLTLVSYRAPELLIEPPIADYPVDIWSCGCIIAELARGTPLFCGDCAVDQLLKICQTMGSPTRNEWPEFYKRTHPEMQFPNGPTPPLGDLVPTGDPALLNLLSKLLKVNPAKRATAAEALRHPYFDQLPAVLRATCLPPEIAGIEGPPPD
jgi:serine/threonine protein kinase